MNISKTLLSVAATATLVGAAQGADLKSPFESLPAETVTAARFDNSPATLSQYVDNTKIGKLLFSEEKIAEYKNFIQETIEAEGGEAGFLQKLGEVGLELDDLYAMITSEIGAAVVMQPVSGFKPMPTMLIWAEMEPGVADQAYGAILEASSEKDNVERTDLEFPGAAGARIRTLPDGSSFLIAKLENRFFFALGQVMEPISTQEEALLFEDAELNALGYFLQAQQSNGGRFLETMYADPGISSARPDHESRLEILGDITKLVDLLPPQNAQMVTSLELDKFTKVGLWSGFEDMAEKSVLFLGAPSPRTGIASLMENEPFEFEVPAWVSSSANTYTSVSFDISKLYTLFIETAKKMVPPEVVDQQIAGANQQLQMMLQTDIQTIVSSFGKRAHVVEYPLELVSTPTGNGSSVDVPRAPQVVVLDFNRPEILQAAMAMVGGFAGPASGLEMIDEQGFTGIRSANTPQGITTIAHGLGKLVIAVGTADTASHVFSAMNTVPEGDQALANEPELRAYLAENPPKPGIAFSVTRSDKILKNLIPVFETMSKAAQNSPEAGAWASKLMDLLPSEEAFEGVLGVGFTRMYYTDSGYVVEGVSEYK